MTVVTKYLFQFGFFPWNTHAVLRRYENKPYFPPRILGLEKTDGYVKYDLVQLMALFFHRSQLLVRRRGRQAGTSRCTPHLPGGKPGCCGSRGTATPASSPLSTPTPLQCYGLWDHEGDQLSKDHDRGTGKKGVEEEPTSPGPQGEPGVAGALAQYHMQAEAGDGPPEPPVEPKPRDPKPISLRFRKRRRESTEPVEPVEPVEPTAVGTTALSLHGHCGPAGSHLEPRPQPRSRPAPRGR